MGRPRRQIISRRLKLNMARQAELTVYSGRGGGCSSVGLQQCTVNTVFPSIGLLTMQGIRFYGLEQSLIRWRQVVASRTGKEGSSVRIVQGRHFFDVSLTDMDREKLMLDWHADSGNEFVGGNPMQWNHCVAWEYIKCNG